MLAPRKRADQEPRDIGIERGARRCFDEAAELAVVARGAEPAPIADHMHVDAVAEERLFANRRQSVKRPVRDRVRCERLAESRVVRVGGFGSDARAGATLDLAREARSLSFLESARKIPGSRSSRRYSPRTARSPGW